jgi:hypothetical protein
MDRLRKTVGLLGVVGIAAAAASVPDTSPDLCFTAGSVTYRLSPDSPSPDYRVAIDNQSSHPDLRVGLVDRVEAADFALTDDAGAMTGSACKAAGLVRTVRIVTPGTPADITIAVSRPAQSDDAPQPDVSVYVHSVRVSHFDAAALFALVRQAPDRDHGLDGRPGHVAAIR